MPKRRELLLVVQDKRNIYYCSEAGSFRDKDLKNPGLHVALPRLNLVSWLTSLVSFLSHGTDVLYQT